MTVADAPDTAADLIAGDHDQLDVSCIYIRCVRKKVTP